MKNIIPLNSSEELAFFGSLGLFFSFPNLNSIFIEKIFPSIIEQSQTFNSLFRFIYIILVFAVTYESIGWVIELAKNIEKTRYLDVNFDFYMFKVVVSLIAGIIVAIFLNRILF